MKCTSFYVVAAAVAVMQPASASITGITQRAYGGSRSCQSGFELTIPDAEYAGQHKLCTGCRKDFFEGKYVGCDGSDSVNLKNDCVVDEDSGKMPEGCTFEAEPELTETQCEQYCNEDPFCGFFSISESRCNLHMVLTCFHTNSPGYELYKTPVAKCKACGEGQYQPDDATTNQCKGIESCYSGTYFLDNGAARKRSCMPCPAGEQMPISGHKFTECITPHQCKAGSEVTYPDTVHATKGSEQTCRGCVKDFFSGNYIFCDKSYPDNRKTDCARVGGGPGCYFEPIENVTTTQCAHYCHADPKCSYYSHGKGKCQLHLIDECKASNSYNPDTTLFKNSGKAECTDCAPTFYQPKMSADACVEQKPCGRNEFYIDSAVGERVCFPCQGGLVQDSEAHREPACNFPTNCDRGFELVPYGDNNKGMTCSACEPGMYQPRDGTKSPCLPQKSCGKDTFFMDSATKARSCMICPPGKVQESTNHMSVACHMPTKCKAGFQWVDHALGQFCEPCPVGMYQSEDDSVAECQQKATCGVDEVFFHDPLTEKSCAPCPSGTTQNKEMHMDSKCSHPGVCPPGSAITWPGAELLSEVNKCAGCVKSYGSGNHMFCDESDDINLKTDCGRVGCSFPTRFVSHELCDFYCKINKDCKYFSIPTHGECDLHLVSECKQANAWRATKLYKAASGAKCESCPTGYYQGSVSDRPCIEQPTCGANTFFKGFGDKMRECVACPGLLVQDADAHRHTTCHAPGTTSSTSSTATTHTETSTTFTTITTTKSTTTGSSTTETETTTQKPILKTCNGAPDKFATSLCAPKNEITCTSGAFRKRCPALCDACTTTSTTTTTTTTTSTTTTTTGSTTTGSTTTGSTTTGTETSVTTKTGTETSSTSTTTTTTTTTTSTTTTGSSTTGSSTTVSTTTTGSSTTVSSTTASSTTVSSTTTKTTTTVSTTTKTTTITSTTTKTTTTVTTTTPDTTTTEVTTEAPVEVVMDVVDEEPNTTETPAEVIVVVQPTPKSFNGMDSAYEVTIRFQELNYHLVDADKLEAAILAALAGGVIDVAKPDAISFSKTAAKAVIFHSDETAALSIKNSASAIGTYSLQYYCHGDVSGSRGCPEEYTAIISDSGADTGVETTSFEANNVGASDDKFTMTSALWGIVAVVIALVFLVAILAVKYRSSSTEAEVATQVLRKMNSVGPLGFNASGFHPGNGSFHGSANGSMMDFNNSYNAFVAGSQSMMTPARSAWSPDQSRHAMSMGAPTPPVYHQTMARRGPGMPAPKIDSALHINGVDRRPSMVTASMLSTQTGTKSNPLLNVSGVGFQYARETTDIGGSSETDLINPPTRRQTQFVEHPPMPPPVNVPENTNFSFAV